MKKLNEVEMNNNDLTVRSSRKELQSIEMGKKLELLERDLANNSQNYNTNLQGLRQEVGKLQQANHQLGLQLHDKQQEVQHKINMINKLQNDLKA